MAPSKIRKALGAVKDKTSIGLAKVASSNSISDLDVAIVKATRHEEHPAEEKHVREILSLTCYSRAYVNACVNTLARRLNKTHNWTVALKTLILIHRLVSEGDPAYEKEIFFATRSGTRLLNMSDFRDTSHPNSWDFSAFVRTFALYLDERIDYRMHGRTRPMRSIFAADDNEEEEEEVAAPSATPLRDMNIDRVFVKTQHLQQLLERFLACRPTGAAKSNRVVIVSLHPIVKESFQIYSDITEIMGILVDRFMELETPQCTKVFEIFRRFSKQFDDLDSFYRWCKKVGIARSSEFPEVERITPKKLKIMEDFIRDKSALANRQKEKTQEPVIEVEIVETLEEDELTSIKALPTPESFIVVEPEEEEKEESKEEEKENNTQEEEEEEADFLNLWEGAVTGEEQGQKQALALFAGDSATAPAWEAFNDDNETADWETVLVQSASNLSIQKAELGGGFDTLLLDGMYQQAAAGGGAAFGSAASSGSASSMAFLGRTPGLLALPASATAPGGCDGEDPFAASQVVAPPPYVQMSEMEKKQQLLVEEQLMWQQYARDGMQGQLGLAKLQSNSNPYTVGGGKS